MNPNRFNELYERYCDGELQSSELDEFKAALREPELARKFLQYSMLESVVCDELRLAEHKVVPKAAAPVSGATRSVNSRVNIKQRLRTRWALWSSGVAAMIALLAAVYLKYAAVEHPGKSDPDLAIIAECTGVTLQRGKDKSQAGSNGALKADDILTVSDKGSLRFKYADGTSVEAGRDSELKLQSDGVAKRLVLNRGELDASVVKQPKDSPLAISTPQSEAIVVGTELNVQATEFTTRLAVTTGTVRFTKSLTNQSVEVSGGYYAFAAPGNSFTPKELPKASRVVEDFTGNVLQRWKAFAGDPKNSKVSLKLAEGKLGAYSLEIKCNLYADDAGGATCSFPSQDWSGYDGVKFWVHGEKSMALLSMEVYDNGPKPVGEWDSYERFIYAVKDDFEGWREVTAPFRLFSRRNYQRKDAPNDGFTLTEIHGIGFMVWRGRGAFTFDRVELYRK